MRITSRTAKIIIGIYTILVIILVFLLSAIPTNAQAQPNVLRKGGFTELSDEDMQDTIQALCDQIVVDCGVGRHKTISCYDWEESPILAYNTLYCDVICVNLSGFRNTVDADAAGETVEYHLVKTIAHEVRHSYQYEHRLDGTVYGNSCFQGFIDYQSYNGNRDSYYAQFIEADAVQWATEYANLYFKR